MKLIKSYVVLTTVALLSVFSMMSGCSSGGGGLNINSLSSIPSTSQLVGGSSASAAALSRYSRGFNATGTPPLMSALGSSSAADQYFWNGLVADIKNSEISIDDNVRSQFYGGVDAGPGGMGACQMVQSVGQAMEQITGNSGTLCYMKRIPNVAAVTPQGSNPVAIGDDLFAQQSEDRWVKVEIRNMPGDDSGSQDAFIRVMGSNNLTGNKYQVKLHFCSEGTVNGSENILVDRDSALLTASSDNLENGTGTSLVTAYLVEQDGVFIIDPARAREGTSTYSGDWGMFKGKILVDADGTVNGWSWNQGDHFNDKSHVRASTSGDSYSELRFLDGAYKGASVGDLWTHNYSGATTFDTTHYKATTTGDLYTFIQSYDLSADSFFEGTLTAPAVDTTGFSCDQEVDYVLDMDFAANTALQDIETACESTRVDYQMCWSGDVSTAQGMLW